MTARTINQEEASAFVLHCKIARMSTAEALAEIARSTWPDRREDLAFGRRRHTPTIRRLARPALLRLDADYAAAEAARQAQADADAAHAARVAADPDYRAALLHHGRAIIAARALPIEPGTWRRNRRIKRARARCAAAGIDPGRAETYASAHHAPSPAP